MEYLEGGCLAMHVKNMNGLTEYQTCFYSAQMLCAILFLHSHEIIHL